MRSPGSTAAGAAAARIALERLLRLTSLALLALMLWASLRPERAAPGAREAGSAALAGALARWTADPGADSLALRLDTVPGPAARAWLVALRRAGASVAWRGDSIPASAIALDAVSEPGGGVRALVAAPPGARVALGDGAGLVDTLRLTGKGGMLRLAALVPPARAVVGRQAARAPAPAPVAPRRVLVLGTAGWEAKFAIAALEERGWLVDARLRVAPEVEVEQGSVAALDTARHGVVVALDSAAAPWGARLARFVRDGGGVVLAGSAARAPALARLAAATPGARVPAPATGFASDAPRRSLGFWPLERPRPDAVPLERREGRLAAAAWRVGAGRVVQVGDDESWRWRMEGGDGGAEAHRAWWSAVVGAAAYRSIADDIDPSRRGAPPPRGDSTSEAGNRRNRFDGGAIESTREGPPAERDAAAGALAPDRGRAPGGDPTHAGVLLARADSAVDADPAPLAALLDALGPPARDLRAAAPDAGGDRAPALRGWMLVALIATLLAEWGSRRLRGVP